MVPLGGQRLRRARGLYHHGQRLARDRPADPHPERANRGKHFLPDLELIGPAFIIMSRPRSMSLTSVGPLFLQRLPPRAIPLRGASRCRQITITFVFAKGSRRSAIKERTASRSSARSCHEMAARVNCSDASVAVLRAASHGRLAVRGREIRWSDRFTYPRLTLTVFVLGHTLGLITPNPWSG